jgi:pimeloyl-ACP methyl ester carboxylesterase
MTGRFDEKSVVNLDMGVNVGILRAVPFVDIGGHQLEYAWHGPSPSEAATLVFLHEGLGSVSLWRDFPRVLAERTGCGALVYSRLGHGRSDPIDTPRSKSFMHDEARVVLPAVLRRLSIDCPILIGHSDGGSIALIHAGSGLGPVGGLVLEAPHVFVEDLTVASIARIGTSFESTELAARLARHHGANTERMFRAWHDIWLDPDFRSWNIEEYLPALTVPALVIQGLNDEYGTVRQVTAIAEKSGGSVATLLLSDCGHSPHVDRSADVLEAMATFVDDLRAHAFRA